MEELQRLVRIIDKYSPTRAPLIHFQDDSKLETKLFNLLKNETVLSDEAVAQELYGKTKLIGSFRTLKSRFRKKLYNHLHFLEISSGKQKSSHDVNYRCQLLLTEAYALMVNSEIKLALKSFDEVIALAEEYEANEMKIIALEAKKRIYLYRSNKKEFDLCDIALKKCYEIQSREREALSIYDNAMIALRGQVSPRRSVVECLPDILEKMWLLYEKSGSSLIFYHRHILQIAFLEQSGRYSDIAQAIAQAEELVSAKRVNTSWYNRKYNAYVELYALLQCRQYTRGLELASRNAKLFVRFSTNWFGFMENYVLLAIHSGEYKLAGNLLSDIIKSDHLRKLGDSNIERWELYRRYFVFITEHKVGDHPKALRSEITTELLILPKDKAGFNQALLVLDVLQKLSDNRVDDLEVQAERVRKYVQKYLRGEKAERPRLFMRLLLLVLTKPSTMARQQGQKLLEQLIVTPLPGDAFTEVEIVPYEHLWELALQLLQQREKE